MLFPDHYERVVTLSKPCACGCRSAGLLICKSGPHYAKRECVDCGRFLGWEPKPRASGIEWP